MYVYNSNIEERPEIGDNKTIRPQAPFLEYF